MKDGLSPLGDRVIVRPPDNAEKSTKSGIMLSDTSKKGTATFAEVIAVGPGIYTITGELIPMSVEVGDEVMYRLDMGGDKLKIHGDEYLIFREQDLLMVQK